MGKSIISMVMFNSYVKLPEGNYILIINYSFQEFLKSITFGGLAVVGL